MSVGHNARARPRCLTSKPGAWESCHVKIQMSVQWEMHHKTNLKKKTIHLIWKQITSHKNQEQHHIYHSVQRSRFNTWLYLERVGCDGSGEDFHLYSRACFSVLTEADAIFCWEIKEGRCKWVKEETERWETRVVSSDFIVHLGSNEGHPYKHRPKNAPTV